MEKIAMEMKPIFSLFKDQYAHYLKRQPITVQRQMPVRQVRHFIKQAVRKQLTITIQLNPSSHQAAVSECTGIATFSPYSSQIILTSQDHKTYHLVNSDQIRHIRIA